MIRIIRRSFTFVPVGPGSNSAPMAAKALQASFAASAAPATASTPKAPLTRKAPNRDTLPAPLQARAGQQLAFEPIMLEAAKVEVG